MINSIPTIDNKNNKPFGNVTIKHNPSDYWLCQNYVIQDTYTNKEQNKDKYKIKIVTPDEARKSNNFKVLGMSIAGATVLTAAALFLLLKGGPKGLSKNFQRLRDYLDRKVQKFKVLGMSIAGATVLTAAALFLLLKGGPKGLSKNFQRLRDYLDRKVQKLKLNNVGHENLIKSYTFIIKSLDKAQQKFEAVNNFATVKDVSFKFLMSSTAIGAKIHNSITRMFEKIGRQAVINSYSRTAGSVAEAKAIRLNLGRNLLSKDSYKIIEINGVRQTKAQWVSQLDKMNDDLVGAYDMYFGRNVLTSRYLRIKKALSGLNDKFDSLKAFWSKDKMNDDLVGAYDMYFGRNVLTSRYLRIKKALSGLNDKFDSLKAFWSKDLVNSFMAENVISKEKLALQNNVRGFRKEISYSIVDLAKVLDEKIIKMSRVISYKDVDKIDKLRAVRHDIKTLVKTINTKGVNDTSALQLKAKVIEGIDSLKNSVSDSVKNKTMDEKVANDLLDGILDLKNSFVNYKQGKVEDMLDIYKKLLSDEDYKILEKSYKNSVKSLDKSINIETEEFVSKVRDLALGGAPTDILTILGSLATLGYNLGKSEDNEQRVSISLKYGIPTIAGIGVSLYCNAKLYAGTKSLLVGGISTIILNKIGVWADDLLKTFRQKKKEEKAAAQNQAGDSNIAASKSNNSRVLDLTDAQTLEMFRQEIAKTV